MAPGTMSLMGSHQSRWGESRDSEASPGDAEELDSSHPESWRDTGQEQRLVRTSESEHSTPRQHVSRELSPTRKPQNQY